MHFFGIGPMELAVVLVIGLLILGPRRLTDTASSLGKFWRTIQRGWHESMDSFSIDPERHEQPDTKPAMTPDDQVSYSNQEILQENKDDSEESVTQNPKQ